MQTFLPIDDFKKSASCLDMRRLGKQRVEAWQILNTLSTSAKSWSNHPATLMWKGFEKSLALYGYLICEEWKNRGYKDTLQERFFSIISGQSFFNYPNWFGNHQFHSAHRSNLLRKNYDHYSKFGWIESIDLPYVWPVSSTNSQEAVK